MTIPPQSAAQASKTAVSRAELCAIVLAAIRERPGCADVAEVSISHVVIEDVETTWRVTILASGGVDIITANHAADRVQKHLRQLYALKP
jgi:hypothetical protein